jgi:parallel beta-helix repeat protein
MKQWLIVRLPRMQDVFVLATMVVVAGPVLAVLPEESRSPVRSLSDRGIVISSPATATSMNSTIPSPDEDGQKPITIVTDTSSSPQQFVSRPGQGWSVRWNPITNTPHLITGRALTLAGAEILTKENIEAVCLDFVAANANLLRVKPGHLRLANKVKAGGRWFVTFQQTYEDVPVLGGQLTTSFTRDDRLITLVSDIYPDIAVETKPKIDAKKAVRSALADCGEAPDNCRLSDVQLCILPMYRPEGLEYVLCWKLYIFQPILHKKWQYLVDAATERVVSKSNVLVYQNITGTVQGEYKPQFADDSNCVATFPYEEVIAQGAEFVIASWNFDSDPGWTTEGQWAFGKPTGGGSFCGDPSSGYTGSNVYGYNLSGNYVNNMPVYYLTTSAVDCSACENVHLRFMRWLGVESSYFDNASIEVSNDGANWTTVWGNSADAMCDGQWVSVIYNISAVADLQPAVYIRWAMGPTDYSVVYPGWNIDDVEIISILGGTNTAQTQTDGSYSVVPPWSPSTILSELKGLYCDINYDCGPDARFTQLQVFPDDVVDFTWNSTLYNHIAESSAYWHVNYVHNYYVAMDPALSESSLYYPSGLDYPMPVTVQMDCPDGYCNAYWDGDGMAFGAGDGMFCDDFALYSEVIYHEYTHAVTSKIYDGIDFPYAMEPGAMNEAWSDYFGCALSASQNPLVGDGGLVLQEPNGFRTLDNTFRRETDWISDVHADSQMLSGSLWDVRRTVENQIGADVWDEIVHFARYAHPQTFEEYLLAVLVEDDTRYGDNNISNGTPHGEAIYTAFGKHGIGGLQVLAPSIVIDDARGNANGKIEPGEMVNLSLTLTNGWANATNISARISTADPFVTIVKEWAIFPPVNHGAIVNNAADPFVILLGPGCPQTHTINFTLDITADGPYNYSRICLFTYAVAVNQLAYEDGQADEYVGYGGEGGALAVRITPQTYPCYPTHIRLLPYEDCTITVKVWDNDGPRGIPGTVLGSFNTDVKATGDWFDVDISSLGLKIDSGSFYVGWVEGDNTYYNGLDSDPPYYHRSWVYFPSYDIWLPFEYAGLLANLMVRVRECSIADAPVQNVTTGKKYFSIQAAINAARSGEQIVVGKGTYCENISFKGKNLVVRSMDPNDSAVVAATIIKGGEQAVAFWTGEDANCVLDGFTVTGGGIGIYCAESAPTITNCIITGNTGEGIYICEGNPTVVNCIITGNGASSVVADYMCEPVIRNCTITGNQGSGITVTCSTAKITNSIIWGNLPAQIASFYGTILISYSDIQGGWIGQGNINADPCFVSVGYWADPNDPNIPAEPNKATAIWVQGDYHLKSQGWRWNSQRLEWGFDRVTSRAIDAGNPGSPLGEEPMTISDDPGNIYGQNLRIDMGAFGGTAEASMPPHGWAILGDLTNDGVLDLFDLAPWAENWLNSGSESAADLNRDRIVDLLDFALLAEDWLHQTSWHN